MSGNVWEWCLNEYYDPRRFGTEGEAARVMRGGWFGQQGGARAAYRDGGLPDTRNIGLGFRVACSSSISPGV